MTEQNPVLLSLGGNTGDTEQHFRNAAVLLEKGGFRVEKVSRPYRNPAVGCEEGAPDFLNIALSGTWEKSPEELLKLTRRIEAAEGRPNDHPKGHSRTLDIDIVLMGQLTRSEPSLILPHPRFSERDFVLIPAAEILPDVTPPGFTVTIGELLELLPH